MSGVPVGDIRSSELTPEGTARVLLAIDRDDYDGPVYDNATVVLRPKSPLNEMYIEMDPGTPAGKVLDDYGVLPVANAKPPVQIDAALAHLDQNALAAVQSLLEASDVALATAPQDLPQGVRATTEVVDRLKPVVDQLDRRRDNLARLVTSIGQLSTAVGGDEKRLTALANSLSTTLRTVSAQSQALRDSLNQLPGVVDNLGAATGNVQQLSDQLDPTLDNVRAASEQLPGALDRLTDTVDTLHTTVDKARPVAEKLAGRGGPAPVRERPERDAARAEGDLRPARPGHRGPPAVPAGPERLRLPDVVGHQPARRQRRHPARSAPVRPDHHPGARRRRALPDAPVRR